MTPPFHNLDSPAAEAPYLSQLLTNDFACLDAASLEAALLRLDPAALADWGPFAASWERLELDTYMADGGRYRRRRYATFSTAAGGAPIRLEPAQPHYQSLEYNRLNGGIARHFAPIEDEILAGATLDTLLRFGLGVFSRLQPGTPAHIEAHQFRIEARPDAAGLPTPEGMHRDGVDFVLVMMVRRHNIRSGTTEVFDLAGRPLDRFTLTKPCDAALVNDRRVMHGVTPVMPEDPAHPAWRDVLVLTYRAKAVAG